MTKVLVTGSSGYIGSHTVIDLLNHGYEVIGIDNQSNSSIHAYDRIVEITGKTFTHYEMDLTHRQELSRIMANHPDTRGIIHFAAYKSVEESVEKPIEYYENNIGSLVNLLAIQEEYKIPYHIFSSSCTVYGNSEVLPVTESTPWQKAESPYGFTKQICEQILENITTCKTDYKAVALRYFNPAGAHPSGRLGEAAIHQVRNLVPLIMETAAGKRGVLSVFGNDYPTRDGSNIRDFIHIMDLAHAHTLALEFLVQGKSQQGLEIFNIGSGHGISVLESIHAFENVNHTKLNYKIVDRRPGDVVAIYADCSKALQLLGWKVQFSLEDIMRDAWIWEKNKSDFLGQ